MKAADIRQAFLTYFEGHDHTIVSSSPLVPPNDPSLLFTNAGMVQFKQFFLGQASLPYPKAASSQACIRAGGKHNDLENVGFTARHHTFFEMLGNFSFGDYFKEKAIFYCWDFITNTLNLPPEKLWVTVYKDDKESADIWLKQIGVSPERLSYCGEEDNFWSMGPTGPCGPCTEVFYDHGPSVAGGPPGSADADGDRYVEIWNVVFMERERFDDGSEKPLPMQSVDTGMGLERIAAVMQGVHDNYEIDLFQDLAKCCYQKFQIESKLSAPLKVILDHIRSITFMIAEGILPSNEGRGYVLRRIIRRAVRFGHKLGIKGSFLYRLSPEIIRLMGDQFPYLRDQAKAIEKALKLEEQIFAKTLEKGLHILDEHLENLSHSTIPGEVVFKLYDTYGFPLDLTQDVARERQLEVDTKGFEACMQKQKAQSKSSSQFRGQQVENLQIEEETLFEGYHTTALQAKVVRLFKDGKIVEHVQEGELVSVLLDKTPFYAESGGQVGDVGVLKSPQCLFEVQDTQATKGAILHHGLVKEGSMALHMSVEAYVDAPMRKATMLNHTATHLMHSALIKVLGSHVQQKGSLVDAQKTRFDFSHFQAMTTEEIREVEHIVNQQIRENIPAKISVMPVKQAVESGAMALFDEKYAEEVRVISIGDVSKELCGGTHVDTTGQIGFFKIVDESAISAGIRRIEAITGERAVNWVQDAQQVQQKVAQLLHAKPEMVLDKIKALNDKQRQLEKQIEKLELALSSQSIADVSSDIEDMNGVEVLIKQVENVEGKQLRQMSDAFKGRHECGFAVFINQNQGTLQVICSVSKNAIPKCPAPKDIVQILCGRGGGRVDFAQGGGPIPSDLDERIHEVRSLIRNTIEQS